MMFIGCHHGNNTGKSILWERKMTEKRRNKDPVVTISSGVKRKPPD